MTGLSFILETRTFGMPEQHEEQDVNGFKIAFELFTRDAGRFLMSTGATLGAIAIGLAAVTWMWFEWKKMPPPKPAPQISALPPPVAPVVQAPPVAPKPKRIKRQFTAPKRIAQNTSASTYSNRYRYILWPVDNPHNGQINYADGYTTTYSWNK